MPNKIITKLIVGYLHKYRVFNKDKINWKWLSKNPAAIHLIEEELAKHEDECRINWTWFIKKSQSYSHFGRGINKTQRQV